MIAYVDLDSIDTSKDKEKKNQRYLSWPYLRMIKKYNTVSASIIINERWFLVF